MDIIATCANPPCTYTNIQEYELTADTEYSRTLRAAPPRSVTFSNSISNIPFRVTGSDWKVSGFVFKGASKEAGLELAGRRIILSDNEITDYKGACIKTFTQKLGPEVGGDSIVIENNYIHECRGKNKYEGEDAHCIINHTSDDVHVLMNDITDCQADGYQTENYLSAQINEFQTADRTLIVGNHIWASCQSRPTEFPPGSSGVRDTFRTIGENAVDLKRTGPDFLIADNLVHGYRFSPSSGTSGMCMGTGSGDPGGAMSVHGNIESCENGTCSRCIRTDGTCGIFEGNDVFDSGLGIGIGGDTEAGHAVGVTVRGNFVHDARNSAIAGTNSSWKQGLGIIVNSFGSADSTNYVIRNTLANLPGQAIRFDSVASNVTAKNNLIVNTADPNTSTQTGMCRGVSANNNAQKSLTATNNWLSATPLRPGDADRGAPGFRLQYLPSNDVTIMPIPSGSTTEGKFCGAVQPSDENSLLDPGVYSQSSLQPLPPRFYSSAQAFYDYRLAPGAAMGQDPSGADDSEELFSARHSRAQACGTGPEFGADEVCPTTKLLFMQETTNDPGNELSSESPNSPDIGLVTHNRSPIWKAPLGGSDSELTLTVESPIQHINTLREGDVYVRIRNSTDTPLPNQEPISVRVWAARPRLTRATFPRDYVLVADTQVMWCEGPTCRGFEWKWVNSETTSTGTTARVFQISASVPAGALTTLRAEIGARNDPRPPFFTQVNRSNNLAQQHYSRMFFSMPIHAFDIFAGRLDDLSASSTSISIYAHVSPDRKVYFFEPNSVGNVYSSSWSAGFPPDLADPAGSVSALEPGTITNFEVGLSSEDKIVQLLVDNRGRMDPTPDEYLQVTNNDTGAELRYYLASPGILAESFEKDNLLPSGWSSTGLWRIVDEVAVPECGTADTGRRAVAFNLSSSCSYETGTAASGYLLSPVIHIGTEKRPYALSFSEWSSTEGSSGKDVRRVSLLVGAQEHILSEASGSDVGTVDQWQVSTFDISDFVGMDIQVKFEFDSGDEYFNGFSGWYIDDVEVR